MIGVVPVFVQPAPRPGVPLHCRRCEVYGAVGETVCWACDQPVDEFDQPPAVSATTGYEPRSAFPDTPEVAHLIERTAP